MNAEFIRLNLKQGERLKRLNEIAIRQLQILTNSPYCGQLPGRATAKQNAAACHFATPIYN